ncbi:hypothetical protein FSP39_008546 [Pinctada imbricata]|uniref:15-hydroxyprostaglandin dehydrogenase [NAD(+)] n=1 Tax=Pinctada imbricata TaxID=66713 RepID=A0AA88Y3V9_PINIB|nr:hypothetical protein FSP39_008546 [Pinctada imbricata]
MRLENKVAIVTGGAQGLGKAFAEELLKKGAKVCICDLQAAEGRKVVKDWQQRFGRHSSMFVPCDVTDHDSFQNVFRTTKSRLGPIDIVVNNAGIGNEGDGWQRTIHINLIGVIEGTRLAVMYMSKEEGGKGGVVVNVASTAGLTPVFNTPVYAGSKYGVVGYTRSMAANPSIHEVGIRFTCLCPAYTDTTMFKSEKIDDLKKVDSNDPLVQMVMKAGVNTIEDVANGFMQLVETDNNNGGVMTVTKYKGIQYRHGKPLTNKL